MLQQNLNLQEALDLVPSELLYNFVIDDTKKHYVYIHSGKDSLFCVGLNRYHSYSFGKATENENHCFIESDKITVGFIDGKLDIRSI